MKEGYRKTEVGFIPNEWKVKTIGELFEFKNGLNKGKEFFGKGTKIINYVDVFRNRCLDNSDIHGLVEVSDKEKQLFNTQKGDVFFTRTSETVNEIGMTTVLLENINDLIYSGFVLRARPKGDDLDLLYKKYCFSDFYARKQIISKSSYTTRALTSGTLLKDVLIKIPSMEEQQKIAEILYTVDTQIYDTDKLIKKTKEQKKGLMQMLLTKGIGHKEFKKTEFGNIPVEWSISMLNEVVEINPKKELLDDIQQVTFIPMEGVSIEGRVIKTNIREYGAVCKGYTSFKDKDVLLAKITPCFENGKKLLVGNLKNGVGFGSTEFHVLRCRENRAIPEFIYYYVSTHRFRQSAMLNMTGSAGQKRVPTTFLYENKLIIPPLKEQEKIAEILSTVDFQIEQYQNKKAKLDELKKGLSQQLLTGKVRVV